ncbi:DUF3822 domain-containing protein [Christiangramia fulva]|uniref:DUF3822 domain-containing protein n=1 Tax=Christiangramia fulva TaxID=2126553 RepID=A0A2R3Z787_9FLAO|nr:DUF3822 family protein [Christiangramia fulva]AVR46141.1 DUF3822 domain-containing protein [Christiangramia fulva]
MVTTNNHQPKHKKLSIQVSLNGLSFCILDRNENSIVFYHKINFGKQLDPIKILARIELEYEKQKELDQPVDEVNLIFTNPLFSLVPANIFDENNASNYLKFNTKILQTDFIAFDTIHDEIINVYIPYTNIINYFFDKYGEFEYRHSLSVLIDSLLKLQNQGLTMYIHTYHNNYDLVVVENGKLLLANSFEYDTKEDFLYYILFTAEQLDLDPNTFQLVLIGDISKDSEEYKMAWDYIRNISFLGPFHSFSFQSSEKPEIDTEEYLLLNSF